MAATGIRESAVQFYAPDHPRLALTVEQKIAELVQATGSDVASGYCQNFDAYKYQVGFIAGLRRAAEICQETDKELR